MKGSPNLSFAYFSPTEPESLKQFHFHHMCSDLIANLTFLTDIV